jgi:rubredoxin
LSEFRFRDVRSARQVLEMRGRVAAGILNIPHSVLRRGERNDGPLPAGCELPARSLLDLAALAKKSLETKRGLGSHSLRASLPFQRPRCRKCRCSLYVVGSKETIQRGRHWYFVCPKCGQRYWSKDGRANRVNPKGGNWRDLKDRIRCPNCKVECRVAASPSKRSKSRFWQCPKCGARYRNIRGRAVLTRPGGRANVELPFLPSRNCPNCATEHLFIKERPRPPIVKAYYFGCSHCGSTFRWNPKQKRLITLRRRKSYTRGNPLGGRPTGMSPDRITTARRLLDLKQLYMSEHSSGRGVWPYLAKTMLPKDAEHSAINRLQKIEKDYRKHERGTKTS